MRRLRRVLIATLMAAATLVPPGGGVAAQSDQLVPLRAFASEDEALTFVRQQSRLEGERRTAQAQARRRACAGPPERWPVDAYCEDLIGAPRGRFDDRSLVIAQSRRHLVQPDGSIEPLQSGRAIQRVGDDVLVMRQGWLVRVTVDRVGARVAATDSTRLLPTAYGDEWHETVHVWGQNVAVVDHRQGYAALRTYTLLEGGGLAPHDSLHLSGAPPTPLDEVASRQVGSRLLLYTAWRIRSDADEPAEYLVPFSGITEDGEPRWAESVGPVAFERVYRPVAPFDVAELLSEVHALLQCELASLPMQCVATMVLAPSAEHYTFADSALVISSATSRGLLEVRIAFGDGLPSARLAVDAHREEHTLRAKGLVVHVPRRSSATWKDGAKRQRDTVRVEDPASGRTWRLGVAHRIDHALVLGDHLVVVGQGDRGTHFSLLQLAPSPKLVNRLHARAAVVQHPGQAVLAAHRLDTPGGAVYRLAYTITDPYDTEDPDRYQPLNAVQVVEVARGRLRTLGIIRASADTFDEEAMLTALEDRQGETQVRIDGDQIVAVLGDEFVLTRVVGHRLVELARVRLFLGERGLRR